MPLTSTADEPLPLRSLARAVADWVGRLGRIWVEGQVTQLSRRPGQSTVFLTLRDTAADVSMQVTVQRSILDALGVPLTDGARVVCWVRPEVWMGRGALQLTAYEIRPVGVGALLARLEALKRVLAAEGLFAAERKQPLPFLPRRVGLITGRASAAERDVVENARRRWPAVSFEVRGVAVQGPGAVVGILQALAELDTMPTVDVLVLARGGGSVEDLLPFSDEALCRAVAACRTPVVSAIGHEPDSPLLDLVADARCSTPTDAGKRVVPDVAEERSRMLADRAALRRAIDARLAREQQRLDALTGRPVLAAPEALLVRHASDVQALQRRASRCLQAAMERAVAQLDGLRSSVAALSPAATLERGYAVVRTGQGAIVRHAAAVQDGDQLDVLLGDGNLSAIAVRSAANRDGG